MQLKLKNAGRKMGMKIKSYFKSTRDWKSQKFCSISERNRSHTCNKWLLCYIYAYISIDISI